MRGFNLSDWALHHRSFIWFLMIASVVAGALSYVAMGREEDPAFTIRTMVVSAALPGATAEETVTQVTDRIERKLQELDTLLRTDSVTYPGLAVVYVNLREDIPEDGIAPSWIHVRHMMSDIRGDFPQEFGGFSFNDDFGDVFGSVYAFTGDGFSHHELKRHVEEVRDEVQQLESAARVELIGIREQVVHIEFSARRLAALGLDAQGVLSNLATQNAIVPSGTIRTAGERILIRISGQFESVEALAASPLRSNGIFFTLSDVAEIRSGYADPPSELFRYNGEEAIGLAVAMRTGGNILAFGEELDALMNRLSVRLPIGIELHKVSDQPHVVEESVDHFLRTFLEAVAIVLLVSFVSLGLRAGFVVSLSIPLVLALTFVTLDVAGVTLQRVSLGALIIALGLLVDDAMIAVETMISRLEDGSTVESAASYAWTSIAWPMLTGTLITIAGFIPIGLNSSQAGEYTRSLFYVIAISLVLSWVVAVLFAPVLGQTFLRKKKERHPRQPGSLRRAFHSLLRVSMRFSWITVAIMAAVFAASVVGLSRVEQQFFPVSDRPEIVVNVTLRQNASFTATSGAIADFEDWLAKQEEAEFWTSYVGSGAPRFVLTHESPADGPNVGQVVVMTTGLEARNRLADMIETYSAATVGTEFLPMFIELGPPVGKPIQYRISAPDHAGLRARARELAAVLGSDPRLTSISLNWNEPARVVRVNLHQARLRQLGLTQADVAGVLSSLFDGLGVTQLREGRHLIDVLVRGAAEDRASLEALKNLQFANAQGVPIPLSSIATLEWTTEQPVIHQRNGEPTITVAASIEGEDQPATIVSDLAPKIAAFRDALPEAYDVAVGGTVESSAESEEPIRAVVPIMLLIILSLAIMQLQSFRLTFVGLAVAPLGLIGVVGALLAASAPLGFVALLGVLALAGILIRNAIILVGSIEDLRREGVEDWEAVLRASDSRARPILLTAAASSLALIPISQQVFWGPMAYAMMGGIIIGTLVTLLFAPALYCIVFQVRPPAGAETPPRAERRREGARPL